nr:MAG TPA: hypothetical protein [Caudoviricetes sp.]
MSTVKISGFSDQFQNVSNTEAQESQRLQKNKIHEVVFKDIKKDVIKSKSGDEFNVLVFTMVEASDPENGKIYEDKVFEFNEKSLERTETTWKDGNTSSSPSQVEQVIYKYRIFIDNFIPKIGEAISQGKYTLKFDNWMQFADTMIELFTKAIKKFGNPVCKLKLIDSKGYANIPNFLSINKQGHPYVTNNFLGNVEILKSKGKDIAFTEREITRIKAKESNTASTTDQLLGTSSDTISNEDILATEISDDDFENIGL